MAALALGLEPAKAAFEYPIFLAVGADRTIYVADQDSPAIFRIAGDGKSTVLYKGERRYRTPLYRPRGIAVDGSGNVFVCDPATMDVYRISPDGKAVGLTGRPVKELNGKPGVRGELIQPEGVAVGADGVVYVSDLRRGAIFRIAAGSKTLVKVANVPAPHGMLLENDGTLVVVSHGPSHLVRVKLDSGAVSNILPGRLPTRQYGPFPLSVAAAAGGYIVTDNYNRCLWRVSKDGKAEVFFESPILKKVTGVAADKEGNLTIADPGECKIYWISPTKQASVAAQK